MARGGDLACMFCENNPCTCDDAPVKKSRAKSKPQRETSPVVKSSPTTDPFAVTQRDKFADMVDEQAQVDPDVLNLHTAIRNLADADMLSADTRTWHRSIISPPLSADVERRLLDWRSRHEA